MWRVIAFLCLGFFSANLPVAAGPVVVDAAAVESLPFLARLEQEAAVGTARVAREALLDGDAPVADAATGADDGATPRLVLLTVRSGEGSAQVWAGWGAGLDAALQDALEACRAEGRIEPDGPLRVGVEIVHQVRDVGDAQAVVPGVDGVMVGGDSIALLAPAESMFAGVVDGAGVHAACLEVVQGEGGAGERASRVRTFRTIGGYCDGEHAVAMYRGHSVAEMPDGARLHEAARAGARYLASAVGPEGRFAYRRDGLTGEQAEEYNILRHAGSLWALLQAHQAFPNEPLLPAADQAAAFLEQHAKPASDGTVMVIVEDGVVKLGGNALACLALAERRLATGDDSHDALLAALADWMLVTQAESGQFTVHKQRYGAPGAEPVVSEYYPGEAVFALVRVHEATGEERYLDAAARGAEWLINVRDADQMPVDLPEDHWLLYGLDALHRHRPDPVYAEHAARLADVIMTGQRRGREMPDEFGGWGAPARAGPTGVRVEGLLAAARLAERAGEVALAERERRAALVGTRFLLACQCEGAALLHVADPAACRGTVRDDLAGFDLRIDTTQHGVSAFLGAAVAR